MTHRLRIEPHGREVTVRDGQSLLDAALGAGINLPHSCKSGHCASCRAQLLSGATHYPNGQPLGLTPLESAQGKVLLCQARAVSSELTVRARVVARAGEGEIRTLPCRIERRRFLNDDVLQLFLRLPATEAVRFGPGQYLDVLLDGGRRRSFSIASPPHDSQLLELHVRRVPTGEFSKRLFDELQEGALLRIELPIGQFIYKHGPGPMLALAGGTGFAPIKSILRHLLERETPRPVHLYWGARQASDAYEDAMLLDWVARYNNLKYTVVLSAAGVALQTHHLLGWIHDRVLQDYKELDNHDVYAAGPPQMISALRAVLPRAGLDPDRFWFDSFDYAK